MKISQSNFLLLLSGMTQYQIPIYQRNYNWDTETCQRLLDDIVKCGIDGNPNHYIGSIIVKEETTSGFSLRNVIDGQQRTTTISLLLLALSKYWENNPSTDVQPVTAALLSNIKNSYLANDAMNKTSLYAKLLPKSGADRTDYENLLHDAPVGTGTILTNYNYFLNTLSSQSYDVESVFNGISRSQLALVVLEGNENPQLLFEAINDTGVDLSPIDLIRNWIFMGLSSDEQERLYRAYWIPLESLLNDRIEDFFRYFTILKSEIKNPEVYRQFKKTFILNSANTAGIETLLSELNTYADVYTKYISNSFTNSNLNGQLANLKRTQKDVFTPLILKILKRHSEGTLSIADLSSMLIYLESYIVRRDILRIPSNSLSDAHIQLLKNSNSLQSFKDTLNAFTETKRMPTDIDMGRELQTLDFYNLSDSYYYLERIEKSNNSAFSLEDPTIEHILPETMHTTANPKPNVNNPDNYNWELDLGIQAKDIHDRFQHTIGNLTILPRGENARMGDYRFSIKKNWQMTVPGSFNYGYLYTPIRISQSLRNYTIWNDQSILQRCAEMAGYICKIWPHP